MKTFSIPCSAYILIKANTAEEAIKKARKKQGKIRRLVIDQISTCDEEMVLDCEKLTATSC